MNWLGYTLTVIACGFGIYTIVVMTILVVGAVAHRQRAPRRWEGE